MRVLQGKAKWKNKIAFQICIIILITNLLTLLFCFAFQNMSIQQILLKNSEKESVKGFEQSEYNIKNFCDQVDLVSRKLSVDANLRSISRYEKLSEKDKLVYSSKIIRSFEEEMVNYSFIKNISFIGNNGVILSVAPAANYVKYEAGKTDWFKDETINEKIKLDDMSLKWFGGYTDKDFQISGTVSDKSRDYYYITAFRSSLTGGGKLLLNVDMEDFFRVFCLAEDLTEENVYMIDDTGKILMSEEKDRIGTLGDFQAVDLTEKTSQKYIRNSSQGQVQVILYPLSEIQMILVNEKLVSNVTSDSRYLRNILLVTCLLCVFVTFFLSRYGISRKLKPLNQLVDGIRRVRKGQLGCVLEPGPKNEIGILTEQFNQMSLELKNMFDENQQIAEEKSRLEMQALRSQINPHLIYNTMNNIKWMALINNERNIAESITLLSDFLEPIFKNRSNLCTVEEELNYVKNYIAIMNIRVAGKYTVEIEVPEEYRQYKIIRFLLQPIVENSILHGIADQTTGTIRISMWNEGSDGYLQIEDDGSGIEEQVLSELQKKLDLGELDEKDGKGVGVLNVNRRIKVQYGMQYGLIMKNGTEKGAVAILHIPLK